MAAPWTVGQRLRAVRVPAFEGDAPEGPPAAGATVDAVTQLLEFLARALVFEERDGGGRGGGFTGTGGDADFGLGAYGLDRVGAAAGGPGGPGGGGGGGGGFDDFQSYVAALGGNAWAFGGDAGGVDTEEMDGAMWREQDPLGDASMGDQLGDFWGAFNSWLRGEGGRPQQPAEQAARAAAARDFEAWAQRRLPAPVQQALSKAMSGRTA